MAVSMNDVYRLSKQLMFKEPFYGTFLVTLNKEFSNRIQTACVSKNGINTQLTINPEFWEKMDEKTQMGILKHELLHIAFFHLISHETFTDKEMFNLAADLEVNQYISGDMKGPKWDGIELSKFPELNLPEKAGSKEYYRILTEINQRRQQQQGSGGGAGEGDGDQQGQDGKGQGKPGKGKPNKGGGDSATNSKFWDIYDSMKAGNKSIASHDLWKEFTEGMSESDKKLLQKQIDHQLKEIINNDSRGRGIVPSELKEYLDSLFELKEPVINWKAYLRQFTGFSNKSYTKKVRRKYNKRFEGNPAIKIKYKKHILVARDTSGSTSVEDHKEFWNEIHHMYKIGIKITVLDADAAVANYFEYKGKPPLEITGRGGTDFNPAIEFYNEHRKTYHAFIYLTDGICPAPEAKPKNKMLWVISSGGTLEYSKNYPGAVVQIVR